MAREPKVKVRITAEDRASASIGKVESRFKRLGSFLKSSFIPLIVGGLGLRALAKAFGSVTDAAAVQETAVKGLDAALSKLGDGAAAVSASLQEQAAALQKVTRFGDEAIIQGQALLATFTQNADEIEQATAASLDFATAIGVDLNTAFLLLGKAAAGDTATLSRYGIILDENIPKTERFAAVIEKMNEQFGGRAQADAKTYAGLIDQISNAFGDLKEKVGQAITENEEVNDQLAELKRLLEDEKTVELVGDLASNMVALGVGAVSATTKLSQFLGTLNSVAAELERIDPAMKKLVEDRFGPLGTKTNFLAKAMNGLRAQILGVSLSSIELARSQEQAAAATDKLVEKLTAEERVLQELTDTQDQYQAALERLGVTLEADVRKEIEANEAAFALLERRFQLGEISAGDFERAQLRVAEANQKLRESLAPVIDGIDRVSTSFDGAGQSASQAGESFRRVGGDLAELRRQSDETAAALDRVSGSSIGASSLIIGDPRSPFAGLQGGTFSQLQTGQNVRVLANGRLEIIG